MACDGKIEQEPAGTEQWGEIQEEYFQPVNSAIGWKTLLSAENLSIELKIILKFQRALFKC